MSIRSAIDALTGKKSKNIEEAIRNIELGGGTSSNGLIAINVPLTVTLNADNEWHRWGCDKTYDEVLAAYNDGLTPIVNVIIGNGAGPCPMSIPLMYSDYMGGLFGGAASFCAGTDAVSIYVVELRMANNVQDMIQFHFRKITPAS